MIEFLVSLDRNVAVGMAQAAAAIALCLGVVVLCRRFAVHVERETAVSLARGLMQMVCSRNQEPPNPLLLRDRRRVQRRDCRLASYANSHLRNCGFGPRRQHDNCQRHECLRAGNGAFQSGYHGACWPDRDWLGARCRPRSDGGAVCSKCRLREPASPSRYAQVTWLCLDTRRYGRHAGIWGQSCLCGHLSVHRRRHDLGRIGYRWTRRNLTYASASFLECRAIGASRGGADATVKLGDTAKTKA